MEVDLSSHSRRSFPVRLMNTVSSVCFLDPHVVNLKTGVIGTRDDLLGV